MKTLKFLVQIHIPEGANMRPGAWAKLKELIETGAKLACLVAFWGPPKPTYTITQEEIPHDQQADNI
jgi:hypothetical protein